MATKTSSMFRCGKCGAAVSADALKCEVCSFVFGSDKSKAKSRPSMVILIQLMALVLAIFSFPTLILAGAGAGAGMAGGAIGPVLLLIILISGGSFLVFWGLVEPKPWGRMAAIVFAALLSLVALLVVGILAQAGTTQAVVFASLVFAVLVWFTVVLSRSETVRTFVTDADASDTI